MNIVVELTEYFQPPLGMGLFLVGPVEIRPRHCISHYFFKSLFFHGNSITLSAVSRQFHKLNHGSSVTFFRADLAINWRYIWYEWNQCRSLYVDLCVRLHITAQSFDSIRARPRWHFSEENEFLYFFFFSHFCNTNKSLSILGLRKPGKGTRPRIRNERTFSEEESRTWDRFKRAFFIYW